jgi:hypothetical protein
MGITVEFSGPVFDGAAAAAMREGTMAVRHRLADEGEKLVTAAFASTIRVDRGVFLSAVTPTDVSRVYQWGGDDGRKVYTMPIVVENPATDTIVTTELATYGPWLEGTGSRNETTRFKGYHGYRMAGQQLDAAAEGIADAELQLYVERCR